MHFMVHHFACSRKSLRSRRLWTLGTSALSHVKLRHLASNAMVVCVFGPMLRQELRSDGRFLELYALSGVVGSACELAWRILLGQRRFIIIGASTAAHGIFIAQMVQKPLNHDIFEYFGVQATPENWLALSILYEALIFWTLPPLTIVGFAGHIGGGVTGYLYAVAMRKLIQWEEERAAGLG